MQPFHVFLFFMHSCFSDFDTYQSFAAVVRSTQIQHVTFRTCLIALYFSIYPVVTCLTRYLNQTCPFHMQTQFIQKSCILHFAYTHFKRNFLLLISEVHCITVQHNYFTNQRLFTTFMFDLYEILQYIKCLACNPF